MKSFLPNLRRKEKRWGSFPDLCRGQAERPAVRLAQKRAVELLRLCTGEISEQKARPLSPMLREEVRKLDQYIEDYKLLCTENIGTTEELSAFRDGIMSQILALEADREHIRNRIRRASLEAAPALKEQAKGITKQIDPLRKRLKSAHRIAERSQNLDQLLAQERQMETIERQKIRERSYER